MEQTNKKIQLSLAQWSLHRMLLGSGYSAFLDGCVGNPYFGIDLRRDFTQYVCGELDTLDLPEFARREFGITAIEYVNTFFFNRVLDRNYFAQLNRRAKDAGVSNVLIMCDFEGPLGAKNRSIRGEVVRRHIDWLMAAAMLDCRAIRVNPLGEGEPSEQQRYIAESLHELAEEADKLGIDVLVENFDHFSAEDPDWLVGIIKQADHDRIGALVDFGNWKIDPCIGVEKLIPYAKGVSAKSYDFDSHGYETRLDYPKLFQFVMESGYEGYVGIEYEGINLTEVDGIKKTKALVEKFVK